MIARLLAPLDRYARPILAGCIFVGLLLPDLASLLRPLIEASVIITLTVSMLRIDWATFAAWSRRPVLAGAAVGWLLLVGPLLTWVAATALGLPAGLTVALVLAAAAPPITVLPGYALLLGLDASLALVVMVAATAMLPLTLAPVAFWLLDLELSIGLGPFIGRIVLFIGLPFLATAILLRVLRRDWIEAHETELGGFTVIMLVIFAIAIMDGVTARLLAEPLTVIGFTAAAFALVIALQIVGAAAFFRLGRRAALTMGLSSGYRNMAVMLVVTAGVAGPDMALYIAVTQLPTFILPMLSNPLYRWALRHEGAP